MKLSLVVVVLLAGCGPQHPTSSAPLPTPSALAADTNPAPSAATPGTAPTPTLTLDECRARPGEALADKGDGSLLTKGCPDGRQELGHVRFGVENGLCCAPAPGTTTSTTTTTAPPAPQGKRPPCANDQSCNDDESVSALWGRCTPLGVCECKPGFELNPRGRCQKSVK